MKKLIILIISIIFLNSCSFDNKSGIWKGDKEQIKKTSLKKKLKSVSSSKNQNLDQIVRTKKNSFKLSKLYKTRSWEDPHLNLKNFYANLYYNENSKFLKLKKLTNKTIEKEILFKNNKIIFRDINGTIYIFSLNDNSLRKFNFYKKKYKNYKLKTFITLSDDQIYIADNMGYIYCIDQKSASLKWAKFYEIPFMSNIKVVGQKIFLTNENNDIFVLDRINGEKQWNFTTDNSIFKSDFVNNLSISDKSLLLLNTNGSAYSINYENRQLNWILNFKDFLSTKTSNIFNGKHLIVQKNYILFSSDRFISLHDINSGIKYWDLKINNYLNPILSEDLIFLFDKKYNLISLDTSTGHLVWKTNFFKLLENKVFSDIKKKKIGKVEYLKLVNDNLFLLTSKAKLIKIDPITGKLIDYINLPSNINSNIIIVEGKIIYFDKKNRLILLG